MQLGRRRERVGEEIDRLRPDAFCLWLVELSTHRATWRSRSLGCFHQSTFALLCTQAQRVRPVSTCEKPSSFNRPAIEKSKLDRSSGLGRSSIPPSQRFLSVAFATRAASSFIPRTGGSPSAFFILSAPAARSAAINLVTSALSTLAVVPPAAGLVRTRSVPRTRRASWVPSAAASPAV